MPIPASQIVEVNPRIIAPGGNDLDFNALFLSSSGVIPLSQFVVAFASASDVGAYFGLDSLEYTLAARYFQGYDNSMSKPTALMFAPLVDAAQAAFVRGGVLGSSILSTMQTITDGTFSITIDDQNVELTGLNFSSATSISAVAETIQTAIRAWTPSGGGTATVAVTSATVGYSSVFDAITVTSGLQGADDSFTYASGSVAASLFLDTTENGAVISNGSELLTPAANMEACVTVTQNFVTFMSCTQLSSSQVIAFSEWAASYGVNYLHVFFDTDAQNISSSPSGTIAQALTEADAGAVCGIYAGNAPSGTSAAEYAAFICSIAACVDYDRVNGTITWKFKGQSGLGANVTNGSIAQYLDNIGMNFVGNYATRNDSFVFLANGEMWGDWSWIDSYLNAVWLNNALQVACMVGFQNNNRVPYTEEGYALVRSWCLDPINRALRSGVIEPGVTLSESQKAQLQREAGKDISQQLYSDGYYLKVDDPAPAIRQSRGTPDAMLWYTYGGSIHKLEIVSTAVV